MTASGLTPSSHTIRSVVVCVIAAGSVAQNSTPHPRWMLSGPTVLQLINVDRHRKEEKMAETTAKEFQIRPYQPGEEQKMADLVNACRTCEWEVMITEEIIRNEWEDSRLNVATDTLAAVDDNGDYIAATEVWFEDPERETDMILRHVGFALHPDYRETHADLLEQLFNRSVQHALSRTREETDRGYALRAWAAATDEWKHQWILSHGFQHVHLGCTMLNESLDELPEVPEIEGIRIEEWTLERDRSTRLALNAGFSTDPSFTPLSRTEWQALYHTSTVDTSLWRIAIDTVTDEVVALAISEIDAEANEESGRLDGWVVDIATVPAWRGVGLGRAILLAAMHALRDAGMTAVRIGVDTTDVLNATRLYESLGFQIMQGSRTYRQIIEDVPDQSPLQDGSDGLTSSSNNRHH